MILCLSFNKIISIVTIFYKRFRNIIIVLYYIIAVLLLVSFCSAIYRNKFSGRFIVGPYQRYRNMAVLRRRTGAWNSDDNFSETADSSSSFSCSIMSLGKLLPFISAMCLNRASASSCLPLVTKKWGVSFTTLQWHTMCGYSKFGDTLNRYKYDSTCISNCRIIIRQKGLEKLWNIKLNEPV